MTQTYKTSFLIILSLIFLLPIFFVPSLLNLENAKALLLALGVVCASLAFLGEVWKKKEVGIPWHWLSLAALFLPLVYLLSALMTTPTSMSLFGYGFEVGTFGYMVLGSSALILSAVVFNDSGRVLRAFMAFFVSFSLVAVFAAVKIATGGSLVWGQFAGNMGSMLGRWTDLAVAFGLLSVFTALAVGMIPMKKGMRALAYAVFVLAVSLLAIINFSTAFAFTLAVAIILFVYFSTVEKHFLNVNSQSQPQEAPGFLSKPTFLPIILGVVSILFLLNPGLPGTEGTVSDAVSRATGVSNAEVRPSFSATLSVSRAVLSGGPLLGSGPNTWSYDWLVHKPFGVNATPFWGVAFPFGVGFIPTQVSSTGILGTIVWLAFFISLVILARKVLGAIPESRTLRFTLVATLLSVIYLWAASFFYAPSFAVLSLAFIFTGIFMAVCAQAGVIPSRAIAFSRDASTNFAATLVVVALVIGSAAFGISALSKTASAFYFKKALDLANTPGAELEEVEAALVRASEFSPTDIHYAALSQIHFAKAQAAAAREEGEPAENLAVFEREISASIEAARSAARINPAGYRNWLTLGAIYSFLVPPPLSVSGAYENSIAAYTEASRRNPSSPEIPLLVARLEYARGNAESARTLVRQTLALKEDYTDAYLFLAQMEIQENNIRGAIASAERAAILMPGNPSIHFELGLLKYSTEDYAGAAAAFSQALASVPDYANAMYYRGLSFIQLGNLDAATADFEALAESNPDSGEVRGILEDLRAGRNPIR